MPANQLAAPVDSMLETHSATSEISSTVKTTLGIITAECLATKKLDPGSEEILIPVLKRDLAGYDQELVAAALERHRRKSGWFPCLADIVSQIEQIQQMSGPDWKFRMGQWIENRFWSVNWGPPPGEPGCEAPPEYLKQSEAAE